MAILPLAGTTVASATSPVAPLVEATLDTGHDVRDSLASAFNPVQMPLLIAAWAADPAATGVDTEKLYRAAARWHFWSGQRWDRGPTGLWMVDPATVPVGPAPRGQVLAAHAALELVQLAALARLAEANGDVYDALVWWSDHARARQRVAARLYQPLAGAHADLDSTGAPLPREGLDALVPLALGADAIGDLVRAEAWKLWTAGAATSSQNLGNGGRIAAIERADALNGWATSPGLRLFEPALTASLVHAGTALVGDGALELLARDALGSVGLAPRDSLTLRFGGWSPKMPLSALRTPPLARARVGVAFLDRLGVLDSEEAADWRETLADATEDDAALAGTIAALTEALGRWRNLQPRAERSLWQARRQRREPFNGARGGVFRIIDSDDALWFGRALDRITEDVVAYHLRPQARAPWRGRVVPAVAGRGDRVELVLEAESGTVLGTGELARASVLWTDGTRLIGPQTVTLSPDGLGGARGPLGPAPSDLGIWKVIVEGLAQPLRVPAAVAVVDPLELRITPLARERGTAVVRADVASRLRVATTARLEVQAPLSFTTEPGTGLEIALGPGEAESFDLRFTPSDDDGPGSYPVVWKLLDASGQVTEVAGEIGIPFEWLRLGPLPADPRDGIDTALPPDDRIELARRFRGVMRAVGWNRLPSSRLSPDGWVRLADADDPAAIHYAYTAFTTGSRESVVRLQSEGAAIVTVNGRDVVRTPDWGGTERAEVLLGTGTNFVLVKLLGGGARVGRFRLDLRDIDGEPLRGVGNSLDMLLDELAYLTRTSEADSEEREVGRDSMRLIPFTYGGVALSGVSVVGSFNGWSPTATRMVQLEDGRWQAKVRLRPGRFEYKFAVDGDRWIADPNNPERVADGFGGQNSVLVVE